MFESKWLAQPEAPKPLDDPKPADEHTKKPEKAPKKEKTRTNDEGEEDAPRKKKKSKGQLAKIRSEADERTVFLGEVPLSMNQKAVKALVSQFGKIESIRFRSLPVAPLKGATNVTPTQRKIAARKGEVDQAQEGATQNAYIIFTEPEMASACVEACRDGIPHNNVVIRVDKAATSKFDPKKTVFCGNLPYDISDSALKEFFSQCGVVAATRIVRDPVTRLGKGIAYVLFKERQEATTAMAMNGTRLGTRNIRVSRARKESETEEGQKKPQDKDNSASEPNRPNRPTRPNQGGVKRKQPEGRQQKRQPNAGGGSAKRPRYAKQK